MGITIGFMYLFLSFTSFTGVGPKDNDSLLNFKRSIDFRRDDFLIMRDPYDILKALEINNCKTSGISEATFLYSLMGSLLNGL